MQWPYLWLVGCGIWTLRTQSILSHLSACLQGALLSPGWPAGVSSSTQHGRAMPLGLTNQGANKVLPMSSRLLGRLPADEIPGVSPLGCALLAVRACLLVPLCRAHPTNFLK
jgi:hypothetical protein